MSNDTEKRGDPLVDEVRDRRQRLFRRHNDDLRELFKAIKDLQESHPDKVRRPQRK